MANYKYHIRFLPLVVLPVHMKRKNQICVSSFRRKSKHNILSLFTKKNTMKFSVAFDVYEMKNILMNITSKYDHFFLPSYTY